MVITIGNKGLGECIGIPASKLTREVELENSKASTFYAIKIAVERRIDSYGVENALAFLTFSESRLSDEEVTRILDECF